MDSMKIMFRAFSFLALWIHLPTAFASSRVWLKPGVCLLANSFEVFVLSGKKFSYYMQTEHCITSW